MAKAARICTAVAVGNFCSGYIGGVPVARYRSLIPAGVIGIGPGFPGNIAGGLFKTVPRPA